MILRCHPFIRLEEQFQSVHLSNERFHIRLDKRLRITNHQKKPSQEKSLPNGGKTNQTSCQKTYSLPKRLANEK